MGIQNSNTSRIVAALCSCPGGLFSDISISLDCLCKEILSFNNKKMKIIKHALSLAQVAFQQLYVSLVLEYKMLPIQDLQTLPVAAHNFTIMMLFQASLIVNPVVLVSV